jgi:hypothetical protein
MLIAKTYDMGREPGRIDSPRTEQKAGQLRLTRSFNFKGSFGMCGKEFLVFSVQASDERLNE